MVLATLEVIATAADSLGVVVKVETALGFENLPDILLAAMRPPRGAVMIARGDLAVECGYERMAELQEEILWLCEAATSSTRSSPSTTTCAGSARITTRRTRSCGRSPHGRQARHIVLLNHRERSE